MADAWSDVTDPAGIGVTIKTGKGYDDSWYTFRGNVAQIRKDIIEFFGMDSASVSGLTLNDIAVNATQIAQGKRAAASALGATVISSTTETAQPKQEEKPQPEANPIFEMIENATSVEDLKRLWAENQNTFADPTIMAAWKARGRALQQPRREECKYDN